MCYWGMALVLGPNINAPMNPEDEPVALSTVQRALGLRNKASEREQAYISALARRYLGSASQRATGDKLYAEAMREVARSYPDDLDAATLAAEALMDLQPWSYWTRDGRPTGNTLEIIELIERVLQRNPGHPGANHLYIHMMEAWRPDLAESAADRLLKLMPGAGHMVHMPSHIYMRVGRYADASAANEAAITADEDYITQCRTQGLYPLTYYPHNIHFLWSSAAMEGRSQVALGAARRTVSRIPEHQWGHLPSWAQIFAAAPLYAMTRFGRWEEILGEPQPDRAQLYEMGIWLYARGMALARTQKHEAAEQELALLKGLATNSEAAKLQMGAQTAAKLLSLAAAVLEGELAAEQGRHDQAIAALHRAVLLEDSLTYVEPADWHYPARQSLGAVLLKAGRAAEAEQVYWEVLRRNPENGWSLFGLMQALRAQKRDDEAAEIEQRFRRAWANADVELSSSRF
jgi:tetratricopeptide (TPR) repeat protein